MARGGNGRGFTLRAKAEGWKRFCERWAIPPFLFWELLPGFHRLQRALELAERAAFVAEGMARWLSRIRPPGKPEATEAEVLRVWGAEVTADGIEAIMRDRVAFWRA